MKVGFKSCWSIFGFDIHMRASNKAVLRRINVDHPSSMHNHLMNFTMETTSGRTGQQSLIGGYLDLNRHLVST